MRTLLLFAIDIYVLVVIARMLMSWLPLSPGSPFEPVYRAVYTVTEPPLRAIRSVVPPLRLGPSMLDLSPVILVIGLQIVGSIIGRL